MNDFKKKYYISNYKITKKNENGKRNENENGNEMRRHVPLPVGITCGGHRLGEGWGYLM